MRVLVVEADARVSNFIRRGLRQEGFSVDVSADGSEAFGLALADPYDVIVLDIVVPQLDGLEVLEHIRKQGSTVPVLMLSARDGVEDRVRALDTGADDYLVKALQLLGADGTDPGAPATAVGSEAVPGQGRRPRDGRGWSSSPGRSRSRPPSSSPRSSTPAPGVTSWASPRRPWGRSATR